MKLKEIINEDLNYVKFAYENWKNDPRPRVKALDVTYPGQPGQKTYGQRDDILGWNLNYFSNPKYARKAIDDITSFAKLLSANKQEMYRRISYFFPEQAKFIRRYMRKYIKGLKKKDGWLWRKTDFNKLKQKERDLF